jgi:hypothetical protein
VAGDEQAAFVADPSDGPGVTVGDCEVAVVASGGDPVAEPDPLTTARERLTSSRTRLLTSAVAAVANGCVECADLVAGVGDDELVAVGADRGQGCRAFDLAGMDDDLAAFEKRVEDLTRPLTGPHQQAEVGVRGIAEPMDRLELVVRFGSHPACGEVEDAATADGRELVSVAEERDGGVRSVGDGEQRPGGVLVEHAGLLDEEYVAEDQARAGLGGRVGPRPVTVLVPAVAVLVDEPSGGEGVGADLLLCCLGGLEGGRDDHESTVGVVEYVARGGEGGGLSGAGCALDHEKAGVAGKGCDDASLRGVEMVDVTEPDRVSDRSRGAGGDAVDQVRFHAEHTHGRQAADVLGDVASFQQRHASCSGTVSDVLDQLVPDGSLGDNADGGDQSFDLTADVGCVPCRPPGAESGEHEVGGDVAVDPADLEARLGRRAGRWRQAEVA